MCDKMAISAHILKMVESDPFLKLQMTAKKIFSHHLSQNFVYGSAFSRFLSCEKKKRKMLNSERDKGEVTKLQVLTIKPSSQ